MRKSGKWLVLACVVVLVTVMAVPIGATELNKININTATVDQLVSLNGIGEKYAAKIIEYRDKNGLFKTPEDIMNVPGIGPKIFEQNKDRIVVE